MRSLSTDQVLSLIDKLEGQEEKFELLSLCDEQVHKECVEHFIDSHEKVISEEEANAIIRMQIGIQHREADNKIDKESIISRSRSQL